MTSSNTAAQKIAALATAITNLITNHANTTSSASTKGHAKAGGTPQDINTSGSSNAGTDNGYYARADHVHKINTASTSTKGIVQLDSTPTTNSSNGVTSGGVKAAIDAINTLNDQKITYMSINDDLDFYIGYDPIISITSSANKNIIQTGQTSILSAIAKTTNNTALEGVPIDFYDGNTLLGLGITNSSGVATYNYVGNGSGKKTIQAKNGSVVSETYPVLDCIWYDEGKDGTGKHNDIWKTTNATITRGTDYTTVTSSAQWGSAYLTGGESISTQVNLLEHNDIVCIEFDAFDNHILASKGFNIRWNDGSHHYFGCSQGEGHSLFYLSKTKQMLVVDGVRKFTSTTSIPNAYLQSVANASGLDVKFANLKIYPVDSIPNL